MNTIGRVIVCERTGSWAVSLRREASLTIRETRTLPQCWEELESAAASFVVVELTERNIDSFLERMARLEIEFPFARAAAVAERRLAGYEWLAREAGAVHFACSTRHSACLADVAARHLARIPQQNESPTERIWADLPW